VQSRLDRPRPARQAIARTVGNVLVQVFRALIRDPPYK
jgi:hypothetical protein